MTTTVTVFPHPTEVRDTWITLSDGCRLFTRIVLPVDADRAPVPAILEFLPYRLTDVHAQADATHHPYWAGHGYAAVRVDIRGTGNSDGLLEDEYLPREQQDACEVIAWLAAQPWCSGAVGMYGKSWGGFNSLQVAACRPPALRAVISAYFTDDRYADDVHHMGGCLLAHENLSWSSHMLTMNALPPDPHHVGTGWRETWLARLEQQTVFLEGWLAHQRRDGFWRQGSICEDFSALDCGVLLIGGWADGYTNAVDRTLAGLSAAGVPCRAIVGPWSHQWPEIADPGPRIGFLQEALRWWDHWLKGRDTGAMDEPPLRAWLQDAIVPAVTQRHRPGRWISETAWPSPRVTPHRLFPAADGGLADAPPPAARRSWVGDPLAGSDSGVWCPYGRPSDLAPDQRAEDGRSLTFTAAPLHAPLEILGRPEVEVRVAADRPSALVAARVCDISPEGDSLLVTRGLFNLVHRDGHDSVTPVRPGAAMTVRFPLDFAGHRFAVGHRVALSLSPTYWPFAWPSPEPVQLTVELGTETALTLPRRDPDPTALDPSVDFPAPEHASAVGHAESRDTHRFGYDHGRGESRTTIVYETHSELPDTELAFTECQRDEYVLAIDDPLSARLEHHAQRTMTRADWRIRIEVQTSLTADATHFTVTSARDAYEGGVRVHALRRSVRIPRDGV
jgi:putative CocE/NonD family hydrolase